MRRLSAWLSHGHITASVMEPSWKRLSSALLPQNERKSPAYKRKRKHTNHLRMRRMKRCYTNRQTRRQTANRQTEKTNIQTLRQMMDWCINRWTPRQRDTLAVLESDPNQNLQFRYHRVLIVHNKAYCQSENNQNNAYILGHEARQQLQSEVPTVAHQADNWLKNLHLKQTSCKFDQKI